MMQPTESYLKVPYDLRPAKQVERRMMIETFQTLSHLGFPISEYQYTGFGSIYFVDFVLFHKLLGISRMVSVEFDDKIRKRVKFNQPFRCVDIRLGRISDQIPKLSRRRKHILWLDYDSVLLNEHLQDLWLAAAHLSRQSVVIVTVDVEPPVKGGSPEHWRSYFREEAGQYLGTFTSIQDFAQSNLVRINAAVLVRALISGLAPRGLEYIPLFSFSYADGHEMITVGGMLGTSEDRQALAARPIKRLEYLRMRIEDEPYRITVPRLTRKERLHLDKAMPAGGSWHLKEFELPAELLEAYQRIYRYLPTYAELA